MSMSSPMTIVLVIWAVILCVYLVLVFVNSFMGMREEDTLYLSAGESKLEAEQREVQARMNRLAPIKRGFAYGSLAMTAVVAAVWVTTAVRELLH